MPNSLRPHGLQHARLPCPSLSPRVYSDSCPLSRWCHPTISSFVSSPPALSLSQHRGLFQYVRSLHQVAKVLELQLQHQSFQRIFMIHSTTKHLWSSCHMSMLCSLLNMEALFSSSQQSCETGTLNISRNRFTQVRWLDKESKQQSQDWNPSHLNSLLFSFLRVLEPPRLTWSWDTLKAGDKSETRWVLRSLLTLSISPHSVFPSLHSPLPTSSSSPPIFITLPYKTAYNFLME